MRGDSTTTRPRSCRALEFRGMSGLDASPVQIVPSRFYRWISTVVGGFLAGFAVLLASTEIFGSHPVWKPAPTLPELVLYTLLAWLGLSFLMDGRRSLELGEDGFSISRIGNAEGIYAPLDRKSVPQ